MIQEKLSYSTCPQLKECYEMAARLLPPDQVQAGSLLRAKAEKMVLAGDTSEKAEGISALTLQEALSAVVYQLAQEESGIQGMGYRRLLDMVETMPDSREKEYARALLALRGGRGVAQRVEATGHMKTALADLPNDSRNDQRNDPRYRVLAEVLQEAGA